jgi:signal transduction histidine kinase
VRVALGPGEGGAARIVVEDDGPGWQDQPVTGVTSGFGLGLLREGLLLCGGRLAVEPPAQGRGARVVVEVPTRDPD